MKTLLSLMLLFVLSATAPAQYGDDYTMKRGKFGLGVKVGPSFPVGEFGDEFKVGYTGVVEVPYNLSENLQLYGHVGYSRFPVDNSKLSSKLTEAQGVTATTNLEAPYSVVSLVLGINYSYRYKTFWPYFTMSAGMYFQRLETSGSYVINNVTTTLTPSTQNWSQGAFAIGLGTLIPIGNEGWAVDLNAKFNSVIDYDQRVLIAPPSGDDVTTRAIRYVSILAGLSYTFH